MIQTTPYTTMSGLGFSLKPPDWLRNIIAPAVKGAKVTVTVPGITVSNQPPTPVQQATQAVEQNVPGGWITIAALAAVAVFVLPKLMRGSRR